MMTPYTYLIGWTEHNVWYYGVRYSDKSDPKDLWKTYFTSSEYVKKFREQHGEPDVIEVRKTFSDKESAVLWEQKVLKRLRVREKDYFLNKTDTSAPPVMVGEENPFYGKTHSEEVLEILRKPKSEKTKKKMRKPKSVINPKSDEHRKSISKSHMGIKQPESSKQKLSKHFEIYSYTIENIHTGETFETTNLNAFCKEHEGCIQPNLVKTSSCYKGKKKAKQSGGYRIIKKDLLPEKKIGAKLRSYYTNEDFFVEDIFDFCKKNSIGIGNLRNTLPSYKGPRKFYTAKGYTLLELYE